MSVVVFKRCDGNPDDLQPREWGWSTLNPAWPYPTTRCPGCKLLHTFAVGRVHRVAPDGTVTPSYLCNCGYHEWIRLDEWEPRAASEPA